MRAALPPRLLGVPAAPRRHNASGMGRSLASPRSRGVVGPPPSGRPLLGWSRSPGQRLQTMWEQVRAARSTEAEEELRAQQRAAQRRGVSDANAGRGAALLWLRWWRSSSGRRKSGAHAVPWSLRAKRLVVGRLWACQQRADAASDERRGVGLHDQGGGVGSGAGGGNCRSSLHGRAGGAAEVLLVASVALAPSKRVGALRPRRNSPCALQEGGTQPLRRNLLDNYRRICFLSVSSRVLAQIIAAKFRACTESGSARKNGAFALEGDPRRHRAACLLSAFEYCGAPSRGVADKPRRGGAGRAPGGRAGGAGAGAAKRHLAGRGKLSGNFCTASTPRRTPPSSHGPRRFGRPRRSRSACWRSGARRPT